MQVLRYARESWRAPSRTRISTTSRLPAFCMRFPIRSAPEHSRQAGEDPGRHELHGNDAQAQVGDAEIDLLAALPHPARGGLDRERTPRRGSCRAACGLRNWRRAFRAAGLDTQIVQEGVLAPGARNRRSSDGTRRGRPPEFPAASTFEPLGPDRCRRAVRRDRVHPRANDTHRRACGPSGAIRPTAALRRDGEQAQIIVFRRAAWRISRLRCALRRIPCAPLPRMRLYGLSIRRQPHRASLCATSATSRSSDSSGAMRSKAIRGRIVKPCTTSVPSTTVKALSTITLRPGNSGGSAKAVAKVTSPRMPHHDTSTPMAADGAGPPSTRLSKKCRKARR